MGNLWTDVVRSTRPIWGNIILLVVWLGSAALGAAAGMLLSDWPIMWMAGGFVGLITGILAIWLIYRLWPEPEMALWIWLFPSHEDDEDDEYASTEL